MANKAYRRMKAMTQGLIDGWADLSGDRNPLHVSAQYAATTRFGGTIAHGHISLAWIEELMIDVCGGEWLDGGHLTDVVFKAPVRPGHEYELAAYPLERG